MVVIGKTLLQIAHQKAWVVGEQGFVGALHRSTTFLPPKAALVVGLHTRHLYTSTCTFARWALMERS